MPQNIPIYVWKELDASQRARILSRPVMLAQEEIKTQVQSIIAAVKTGGPDALKAFTERFDGVAPTDLMVTRDEMAAAGGKVAPEAFNAMKRAFDHIKAFHEALLEQPVCMETTRGVVCRRETRPIGSVGLYIPGGVAPLPSTVLMLGVPSLIAGCPQRIMCTPPRKDGSIDPHVLVAAELVGVTQVFKAGGAQAIAAMAYGCGAIPKVDKIFGPGNAYVTAAKVAVAGDPDGAASDMPAGPSEVMVVADHGAFPAFIAADLLSQAEHGRDSHAVLVVTDRALLEPARAALTLQLARLTRREIAAAALKHSVFIVAADMSEALAIANLYAPEHLILASDKADDYSALVQNAGSVFLGHLSPESMGDYASGTNHVLPTYGFARTFSGLAVHDFMKRITLQKISAEGMRALGPIVETLARIEGLEAHERAVTLRLETLR